MKQLAHVNGQASEVVRAVLAMPVRRDSTIPELLRAFEHMPGSDLLQFLKRCSGMTFVVPGPRDLMDVERDIRLAVALMNTPHPAELIRLCLDNQVTYAHLKEVHLAVWKKPLHPPPTNGTVEGRIEGAAALIGVHKGGDRFVQEMFDLKSDELRRARILSQKSKIRGGP